MEEMSGEGGSSPAGREAVGTDGVPHRAESPSFHLRPHGKKTASLALAGRHSPGPGMLSPNPVYPLRDREGEKD